MTQQELNSKYDRIHCLWLEWMDKLRAAKDEGSKLEAMQKSNLCYVFLHALKFVGADSKLECKLTPFSYNQRWSEVLEFPKEELTC